MRVKISVLLFLVSKIVAGQDLDFIGIDWLLASTVSREMKRPIFAFVSIKGCASCVQMEKEVFSDPEVKRLLEDNFILVKINGLVGQGKEFVKDYYVRSYPTLLFFDSALQLIHRNRSLSKTSFLQVCRLALNPNTRIPALIRQFQTQRVDSSFLKNYIKILCRAELSTAPAIDSLFRTKKLEFKAVNIEYMDYLNSCRSEFLDFVIANRKKYFPGIDCAGNIEGVFNTTQNRLFAYGDFSEPEYLALKKKIVEAGIVGWEDRISSLESAYAKFKSESK